MNLNLLKSCFEEAGFKNKNESNLIYNIGKYVIILKANERIIVIIFENQIIYETGLPYKEQSIVKWIQLLIKKHEKEIQKSNSDY